VTIPSGLLHAAVVLGGALAIDLALGEPPARLHPVVWMGGVISALVRRAPRAGRARAFAFGLLLALGVPALFAAGAAAALRALQAWPVAQWALEALLLKSCFAVRALGEAALAVGAALRSGDLGAARFALRSLCSRDAAALDGQQVAAAAVESVAENASDSAVAPLLWWALLGVPGAMAYRAMNTLDARIGYHGEYEWLGKASARLDDLLNLVPARLTAALLVAAGALRGGDARRGVRTLLREGRRTESPNAGRPMAAMAGLLGVELEKVGCYRLGEGLGAAGPGTIVAAWRIAFAAALAAAALAGVLRVVLAGVLHA
jgi:adenosylcobinamide-phosphate synthase